MVGSRCYRFGIFSGEAKEVIGMKWSGEVICTECGGRAYPLPAKEQTDNPYLIKVRCTSCGAIKTWNLREKPQVEKEICGDVKGRTWMQILQEVKLPWW